jgi:mRNA interferase MazF
MIVLVSQNVPRYFVILDWVKVHIHLQSRKSRPSFKEGEIRWCSIGINVGVEILGKGADFVRPVLIYKKLDAASFLAIPLTTQPKEGSWYVHIKIGRAKSVAIIAQARVLDSKRLLKLIGTISDEELNRVRKVFADFYGPKTFSPRIEGDAGRCGESPKLPIHSNADE